MKVENKEKKEQQVQEALKMIQEGVKKVYDSEEYKKYLKCCSRFHSYSINNIMLIYSQFNDATRVAGYTTWKNLGRYPKKGEHGIKIIAPNPFVVKSKRVVLDEKGEKNEETVDINVMGYRVAYVFDISQTEGKALPEFTVQQLDGVVGGYKDMMTALVKSSRVPVEFDDISGGANGIYDREAEQITVQAGMSELMSVKTLVHEMAHAELHNTKRIEERIELDEVVTREQKEAEAESVAYCVCSYFGLNTAEYSFRYVAAWSQGKTMAELKASLDDIRTAAGCIIDRAEKELSLLAAEKTVSAKQQDREAGVCV